MSAEVRLPDEWLRFAPRARPLTGTDRWNVFISYRSINRPWVLNLYDVLRRHGHEVFIDQCELRAGDQLQTRLQEALQKSQAGALIWSSAAADSEWVNREYNVLEGLTTTKKGFLFIPVKLDNSPLPLFASTRIFLDFSSYPDGPNGGELLRLLYALVDQRLSAEAVRFASDQEDAAGDAAAKIGAAIRNGNADRLMQLFEQAGSAWEISSALACKAGEGLTRLGRNDAAITMLGKVIQRFPKAVRPKQLYALALARRAQGDDLLRSQEILGELYELGQHDPETLGIYARTWMDRYDASGHPSDLRRSRDLYAGAFEKAPDDYYTGVNAAAKSVLMGTDEDLRKAADYASRVQAMLGTDPRPDDYWATATIGEIFLMQQKYEDAARLYDAAVGMANMEVGSQSRTWKQACRLMTKLRPSDAERALIQRPFANLPDCATILSAS